MPGTFDTDADLVPRSTGRLLDLLEIVLAAGTCNLTTAATAVNLTPTTALRHLRALEARGYLARNDAGMFFAGPTLLRIAASLHESGPLERLVAVAQPHLDALAAETGESAYLVVSDGRVASYIATAESRHAIRHVGWIGQTVTLDGTAVGEAITAPGVAFTRTGAVEPDITAVSFGLVGAEPTAIALSVIGPAHRFDAAAQTAAAAAIIRAATALGHDLGLPCASATIDQAAS